MPFTCEQAEHLLASYALGALDGESRADLEQHLPGCPACRLLLEQDQQIVQQLPRAVNLIDPPPSSRLRPNPHCCHRLACANACGLRRRRQSSRSSAHGASTRRCV
ncbi:MAG: hypothetical protein EXR49_04565 [Dehalococcoidia bacterium]|nr:hypothetical protein [Dehalococcoidia bacterium]